MTTALEAAREWFQETEIELFLGGKILKQHTASLATLLTTYAQSYADEAVKAEMERCLRCVTTATGSHPQRERARVIYEAIRQPPAEHTADAGEVGK